MNSKQTRSARETDRAKRFAHVLVDLADGKGGHPTNHTHRIGQANKVIAYRLLIKDSIEEKIRALQKTKTALADDVLGEEKFSQSLTLDDLRYLFSDDAAIEA